MRISPASRRTRGSDSAELDSRAGLWRRRGWSHIRLMNRLQFHLETTDGGSNPVVQQRSHGSNYKPRSEEHTSELQSHLNLVCRLLLEKKKIYITKTSVRS